MKGRIERRASIGRGSRARTGASIRSRAKPVAGSKGHKPRYFRMPCFGRACRSGIFQRGREDTLMSRGPATGLTEASGRLGADGQKRGRSRNRCDSGRMRETRVRARRSLRTPGLTGCGLDAEPDLRKINNKPAKNARNAGQQSNSQLTRRPKTARGQGRVSFS